MRLNEGQALLGEQLVQVDNVIIKVPNFLADKKSIFKEKFPSAPKAISAPKHKGLCVLVQNPPSESIPSKRTRKLPRRWVGWIHTLLHISTYVLTKYLCTKYLLNYWYLLTRTTDAQWSFFHQNPKLLGLDRQFGRADKFWGIFGQFISTHFGAVGVSSMFSINQPLFLQKN